MVVANLLAVACVGVLMSQCLLAWAVGYSYKTLKNLVDRSRPLFLLIESIAFIALLNVVAQYRIIQ